MRIFSNHTNLRDNSSCDSFKVHVHLVESDNAMRPRGEGIYGNN